MMKSYQVLSQTNRNKNIKASKELTTVKNDQGEVKHQLKN